MHAESYDINVRFLALLWSPSLDMDISSPAAGVPSFPSWKWPGITGDSGSWHSANIKSVITPDRAISVLFGVQEPLMTYTWEFHPRRQLVIVNNVTEIIKKELSQLSGNTRPIKLSLDYIFHTILRGGELWSLITSVWKPIAVLRVETTGQSEDPVDELDLILWNAVLGPVHTYPEWKFLNTLWIRNSVDAISGILFLSSEVTRSSNVLYREYSRRCLAAMLSLLFYFLDFSFKSWKNMCAVKPSYDYCTIQLCQTAARHFKASFYLGWTNWTP